MKRPGPDRLALAIVVPLVTAVTFQIAHGFLVAPLTRELATLEAQIRECRAKSSWIQSVREKGAGIESQLDMAAPIERDIANFLVGETDRVRIGEARDKALQNLDAKYIPEGAPRTTALHVDTSEDLDLELNTLKKKFIEYFPKGANLGTWMSKSTVSLRRVDETFGLECSLDVLLKFIARIEASSPMLEVTRLQVGRLQVAGGGADRVQATLTVSTVSYSVDED